MNSKKENAGARKVRKWRAYFLTAVLAITFICNSSGIAYADNGPGELYARAAVLMDADSGRVLYEKNGDEMLPHASTTKVLTCILALEEGDLSDVCEVSAYAASQPAVRMGVRAGEQYLLGDLLYALMLESDNDAAVIIAESVAGSVEAFAELMNQKAWDLGCESTYFITPNGLDAADANGIHATSATDLARIMSYAIQNSEFLAITQTDSYTFSSVDGTRTVSCTNHNAFLHMMDGALSGKTGFTGNAGYCYTGALRRGDRTFVVALLACGWPNNKSYKWKDTRKLMEYALEEYEYRTIWREPELPELPVADGVNAGGELTEVARVSLRVDAETDPEQWRCLLGKTEEIGTELILKESLTAPLSAGTTVGRYVFRLNEEEIASCPVVTEETIEKVDFFWCLRRTIRLLFWGNRVDSTSRIE